MPFSGGHRPQKRLWTPKDSLSGLSLWLDAADTSTLKLTSGAVNTWIDKSPKANTVFQATSANQPTFVAGAMGSTSPPNVYFTAANTQFLATASNTTAPLLAAPRMIVAAYKPGSGAIVGFIIYGPNSMNQKIEFGPGTSVDPTMYGYSDTLSSTAASTATQKVSAFGFDGINGTIYSNGQLQGTATMALNTGADPLFIGGSTILAGYYTGAVNEILIFDYFNANLLQVAVGYMAWRWGTQNLLPANHPYLLQPPKVTF